MKVFHSVVPIALGFLCLASSTAASVDVWDANNQYLGTLVDGNPSQSVIVFVPSLSLMVPLSIYDGSIMQSNGLMYESANCTGLPLCHADDMYSLHASGQLLYTGEMTPPEIRTVSSYAQGGDGSCASSQGITPYFVPARFLTEADLPFSVPIALPLRFEISQAAQPAAVPAVSIEGLMVLAAALLGVGTWILVKRR